MEALFHFLVSPTSPQSLPLPYPLDYLEDHFRLPAGDDKPHRLLVTVAHEPMVVSGGIRAQQDLNPGKMLPQIPEDFPDQAYPATPQHPQKRIKSPEAFIGAFGNPHSTLNQSRVDIQYNSPDLTGMIRPYGQPHPALGETMNVPPSEPPGQVRQRVRPRDSVPPQQSQQPRIGPQKIDIRQPVATLDDHLEKREDLGRNRMAALTALEMGKATVELLAQADIFGEGHEQSQAAGSGDFGAIKGTEFEILNVLTYHEDTSYCFTCGVKSPDFFASPVFYQVAGEIEASFFI
jgi:hypothetical protein